MCFKGLGPTTRLPAAPRCHAGLPQMKASVRARYLRCGHTEHPESPHVVAVPTEAKTGPGVPLGTVPTDNRTRTLFSRVLGRRCLPSILLVRPL